MTHPAILFVTGVALAALIGCAGPSPTLSASIEPGHTNTKPVVLISANGLSPQTDYLVGISTVWSPEFAGRVRSDPFGSISPTAVSFECPYVNVPPVGIGLFLPDGIAVARTVTGVPTCEVRTPTLTPNITASGNAQ